MKGVIIFLLFVLFAIALTILAIASNAGPQFIEVERLPVLCCCFGGLGGVVYCLRAVYLNACVRRCWAPEWQSWYYIRPFVSGVCGGISWLFLRAGLLALDATSSSSGSHLGYYALAFIAGLNVDKFLAKLEDLGLATWGIGKSRAANAHDEMEKKAE